MASQSDSGVGSYPEKHRCHKRGDVHGVVPEYTSRGRIANLNFIDNLPCALLHQPLTADVVTDFASCYEQNRSRENQLFAGFSSKSWKWILKT